LTGSTDKRAANPILIPAWSLADQHDSRTGNPVGENELGSGLPQGAPFKAVENCAQTRQVVSRCGKAPSGNV
jgi:hypothetical protein